MAIGDIFKVSRKTFFDPKGWLGYDELKSYNRIIYNDLKEAMTPAKPERKESFAEAMDRLNLTEADVEETAKRYLMYTVVFVILAGVAFATAFYMLFAHGTFSGWILAVVCSVLFLVQAFRFHFWHFQIKYRKLGCTFREWWRGKPDVDKDAG